MSTNWAIAGISVNSHSLFKGKHGFVAVPTSEPVTGQSTRYGTPLAKILDGIAFVGRS